MLSICSTVLSMLTDKKRMVSGPYIKKCYIDAKQRMWWKRWEWELTIVVLNVINK